ncbi:hypothetical protein [Curtobacterium flaccumfaciens]|uniref:hypothetical protein n=1 Tax=Curtobacterium flaccumfaciens TaxID=2035 RepID=UPI0005AC1EE6|nr:hypothetical protein [Curtobacterium flaccumfaciens]KIQ11370.1 hypothetical protein RU06_04040 [Curtobacterium flaccumfaciens]
MQNRQNPLGGAYVTGLESRAELGAFTGDATRSPIGSYTGTGIGIGRALGRFVDTQFRRPGTATSSSRTVTGSFRTATGSFRTA